MIKSMFSSMPTKSYKAKKSKNPRGIVIGVFQVIGRFREPLNPWMWRNYTYLDVERLYL